MILLKLFTLTYASPLTGEGNKGYFRENPSYPAAPGTTKDENSPFQREGISPPPPPLIKGIPKAGDFYFRGKLALQNKPLLSRLPESIRVFLFLSIIIPFSVFVLSGCSTGAYPVDVFPEGHYQQSYRSQEPPRLQPPTDSVPIGGKEIAYNFTEAGNLTNPLPLTPEIMAKANQIYQVNCAVCHGIRGRGDGPMTPYFQQAGAPPPLDYASPRVRSRKAGELYWIITNGLGVMPRFGPLLTVEERWALVHFINSVSGSNQ